MHTLANIALMIAIACTSPEPGITADLTALNPPEAQTEAQETISEDVYEEAEEEMEYLGQYTVTEYNFTEGGGENYSTAGGYEPVPYWTCAAPYDIPMGTIIYVDGLGEFQVQDRGGFSGNVIDIHTGYEIGNIGCITRDVYIVK